MVGISSKWKQIGIVGFIFVLTLSLSVGAYAQQRVQDKTFVVIGSSTLRGTTMQAARDRAISESLVTAVALMTEEVLKIDSLVENFPQVNSIIFGNTDAFVQEYKVLTENEYDK